MNVRIVSLGLLLLCALAATEQSAAQRTATQIPNLDVVKAEIRAYYDSGNWERETAAVVARAQAYVDDQLQHHPKRPAIVLDIDDTSLSDYGYEASHDFGYDPHTYDMDIAKEAFPAILPTLHFAQHVKKEGVAVFFITGRRTPQRAATLGNLLRAGYPRPDGLMLRPVGDRAHSVIPFKSSARARVEALGYTVLLSMGDQWSDLRGGYAERDFKLPNPMYIVP
jgi:predicted secreted acid phosphatase